ncbi:uncharacterized protein TNCT_735051 [Trichonephila clavata]|uniref:Transposase Tc1-like domain-containing protein n=1 Tax=Trichonephila clavata TaxID=2740835 RepID=A0A8X6LCJ9_TRICU|nr:uncharacterized protein TNCT_735051 [Trichonephila clavata]
MSSRRETTVSERLLVVKWSKEGKSLREIASLIGVTHCCVQKILQKYKKTGYVANIPGRGRKEILSTTAKRNIIHSVKKDPRVSASKLALSMSSTIGEKTSDETIRRTLNQYGFHGRTPIRKPLIKKILCYLRGIQRYVIGPMLLVMKPLLKRRISTIGLVARGKKVSLRMIAQPGGKKKAFLRFLRQLFFSRRGREGLLAAQDDKAVYMNCSKVVNCLYQLCRVKIAPKNASKIKEILQRKGHFSFEESDRCFLEDFVA